MQGVANRDIKLENTLLDGTTRPLIKICDFGYSKVHLYLRKFRSQGELNHQHLSRAPVMSHSTVKQDRADGQIQEMFVSLLAHACTGVIPGQKHSWLSCKNFILYFLQHEKFQSEPGSRVGTPAYLAPEVILTTRGKTYDGKA